MLGEYPIKSGLCVLFCKFENTNQIGGYFFQSGLLRFTQFKYTFVFIQNSTYPQIK